MEFGRSTLAHDSIVNAEVIPSQGDWLAEEQAEMNQEESNQSGQIVQYDPLTFAARHEFRRDLAAIQKEAAETEFKVTG